MSKDNQPISIPRFVVVGRVNKGKSSLVATLAEDDNVAIDRIPGTTQFAGVYGFKIGDRVLFELIDTPGFQEARHALAWMRERTEQVHQRPDAVKAFVEQFQGDERFVDEVRLLQPLLEGEAGILYVVDGSRPYREGDEAEMEILRWTGCPAMALINQVREQNLEPEWRPVLTQYFNLVRTFNAHEATYRDRLELLRGFRELRQEWRGAMDEAIEAMNSDRRHRMKTLSKTLAEYISNSLTHIEKLEVPKDSSKSQREKLERDVKVAFENRLRKLEKEGRKRVERIFRLSSVSTNDQEHLLPESSDLFSETSMRTFGLTKTQLTYYAAMSGAAIGGAIDLTVGGLFFCSGTIIGGTAGFAGAYFGGDQASRVLSTKDRSIIPSFADWLRSSLPSGTGEFIFMGPVTNPHFAWVLVDRALSHARAITSRAHARRDAIVLPQPKEGESGIVAKLPKPLRDAIDKQIRAVLKKATHGKRTSDNDIDKLAIALLQAIEKNDSN